MKRRWLKFVPLGIVLLMNFFVQPLMAQDFDVFHRREGDQTEMPRLYENMLFEEFQLLERDVRMMDMAYSAIVPGYVHFKAKDNAMGFVLLGTRTVGFAGIAANMIRMKNRGQNLGDIWLDDPAFKTDQALFVTSLTLILSSYLFDWIHGKYRLEKKQELIRYKYGIKLKMDQRPRTSESFGIPSVALTLKF